MSSTKQFCVYRTIKADEVVIPPGRQAAIEVGQTFQDWVSDLINVNAAKILKRKPLSRLPPPPKPHGKGRPRKP